MNKGDKTITIEDKHFAPFFNRTPVSIERGKGVYVWDESGKRYLDFTSGWGGDIYRSCKPGHFASPCRAEQQDHS